MGNCCSSDDPLVRAFRLAPSYGEKADIVLKIAARSEREKRKKDAIIHYGTYIHCAAVHVYKEDAKKSRDLLVNKVNMARRIMTYRSGLEMDIQRRDKRYVAPLISSPQQLAPWEWQEWLAMLRSGASLDALLERFGLLKLVSQHNRNMQMAAAMATSVSVNPNISVAPTINNNPNIAINTGTHNESTHTSSTANAGPAGATAAAPGGASAAAPAPMMAQGMPAQGYPGGQMQPQYSQPHQMQPQYSQQHMQPQYSQPHMQPQYSQPQYPQPQYQK